ncbi:hypothetical protein [Empedobacter brevis]|uniref:hypothetical protein n=1 Tax=Empedobacter brevis TaxID=247 RepID=UPI0039B119DD
MKKLALFAFAAISFTAFSCKQKHTTVGEPTMVVEDSVNVEKAEIPAADSVEGVTVDSSKTENSAQTMKDSVAK